MVRSIRSRPVQSRNLRASSCASNREPIARLASGFHEAATIPMRTPSRVIRSLVVWFRSEEYNALRRIPVSGSKSGLGAAWRARVTNDEIPTTRRAALLRKLADRTLCWMARRGQPGESRGFEIREQWRIRRLECDKWIAERTGARGERNEDRR